MQNSDLIITCNFYNYINILHFNFKKLTSVLKKNFFLKKSFFCWYVIKFLLSHCRLFYTYIFVCQTNSHKLCIQNFFKSTYMNFLHVINFYYIRDFIFSYFLIFLFVLFFHTHLLIFYFSYTVILIVYFFGF